MYVNQLGAVGLYLNKYTCQQKEGENTCVNRIALKSLKLSYETMGMNA